MKTLAQLEIEQAKQREVLQAQHAIAEMFTNAGLPVPDYIGGKLFGATDVTFWNRGANLRDLSGAISIFENCPLIVPFNVLRNGSTILTPESDLPEKNKAYKRDVVRNAGDYALLISTEYMHDSSNNRTAELQFFTRIDNRLFNVSVNFGTGYIGRCDQLMPRVTETKGNGYNPSTREFHPNEVLRACSTTYLNYDTGEQSSRLRNSSSLKYLFSADMPGDAPPSQCAAHAIEQLQSVVTEARV